MKRRLGGARAAAYAAGIVALLIVIALSSAGTLQDLEHRAVDARFEVRGTERTDELAVVAIDEQTFSTMDVTWPIRRSLHADMIDRLRAAGARRIVYDVQFTEPSDRPADDLALFDAVAAAPGTVLATGESDAQGGTRVLGGDAQLAEIGARAAGSTFPSDKGGVMRRYSRENAGLESLATVTADSVGRPISTDRFPTDGTALIDFRGPSRTIPTYSFVDVLEGRVDAGKLRNRIIVVGATAPVLQDVHPTSAPGARMMAGPEIQANAIWTALQGNPLRDTPGWVEGAAALALGLLGLGLVALLGPLRALVGAVALGGAYAGAAALAFNAGLVLPVATPLSALGAAVATTALVMIARERAQRAQLARYSAQLEREVRERTAALEDSQLEVVLRLARAAELRDDDTGEHIDRMSSLCGEVARELGQSEEQALMMQHASALHDIGKIGVPDSILLKPGRLTREEFAVMQEHVVAGAELLTGSTSPVLQLAEVVCRSHHEKWDGSGYPSGVAGEAIPLPGRIAAVCDVFDALTHERPYKRAWSVQEACAEIARCSGAHFDPAVAEALLAIMAREHGSLDLSERLAA
ncbi:MAG: CHASE2 domain-containing protein [Solirubrobacteraceae bacterium]|nr:CHASE2 domain-containing protein [Solirubrobacteraceae bacterium]